MAVLFQNTTKLVPQTFSTGAFDADAFHERNALSRENNKKRRIIATVIACVGLAICEGRLLAKGLTFNYRGFFIHFFIFAFIGAMLSEFFLKMLFPDNQQVPVQNNPVREVKYSFTNDKIMVTENFNTNNLYYNQISRVTQDAVNFYIYTTYDKLMISKGGFNTNPSEFEKLMASYGFSICRDM